MFLMSNQLGILRWLGNLSSWDGGHRCICTIHCTNDADLSCANTNNYVIR